MDLLQLEQRMCLDGKPIAARRRDLEHTTSYCFLCSKCCAIKSLDCSKTQNPSWTLKLSLILGHRLSRAVCTHDHGEPSEQRFSSVIIIAQNPSTQNVFVCVKKQIPRDFFLAACFASLCLQLAHCYLFLGDLSSWIFPFFWE